MLNKLLLWLFKRRFKRLSTDEQKRVRELVDKNENVTAQRENKKETKKRRTKKMEETNEKEVKTEKEETKKVDSKNEGAEKETEKTEKTEETDKKEEKSEEENKPAEEQPSDEVQEVSNTAEGLTIDQIATKDMVNERFSALEAKIDAILKENADLKEEIAKEKSESAKKDDELNGMKEKYENSDFGTAQKKGMPSDMNKASSGSLFDDWMQQYRK